jgi:HSP90 family molecular chaperone
MESVQKNSTQYETYNYSADTANVMSILVKSIYTNKDIFLRELISNASDAINKVCLIDNKYNLDNKIVISYEPESHQITIQDSGCGITKQDLISKIGSIGTSGTKQFMEAIAQSKDKLIGQFGVGFYSVYLVAKSIQIITKPVQEPNKTYEWVSQSESTYSIRELVEVDFGEQDDFIEKNFTRGTVIKIILKEDSYEYLEQDKLIEIIKTHSSYIEHPIYFEKHEQNFNSIKDVISLLLTKLIL